MPSYTEKLEAASNVVKSVLRGAPRLAVILGSGLGGFADTIEERVFLPYSKIPYFPTPSVEGHAGRLVFGRVYSYPICVMQGRIHYYEGYSPADVVFPLRVLGMSEIEALVITNAAGAVNPTLQPGDLMMISDHLNLTGMNPLIGPNVEKLGTRFPDMSEAYSRELRDEARKAARRLRIPLKEGVYAGLSGPSYETPAEIRMLRILGAEAVGMSTVSEVIAANHMGIKVLGISCITNLASGVTKGRLSHQEVKETGARVTVPLSALLRELVGPIHQAMGGLPELP